MTLKLGKRQHFTNCNARMQKLNALTRSLQINGWRTRLKTIVEKCPNWMALATSQRRNNLDYMYIFPFGRRGPSRFFDVFPSPSVRSDIDMYLENVKYAYLAIWQFDLREAPQKNKRENVGIFPKWGTPPPSPLFGNDTFVKTKYGLFCISGP